MTEKDIISLIEQDKWMMDVLKTVQSLHLPDWLIGAGFVRSKVWDHLHEYKDRTSLPDIDVIYFDKDDFTQEEMKQDTTNAEIEYEKRLKELMPDINWSVTNQARMHAFHNDEPYKDSEEALSRWVETATCIGVCLNEQNEVTLKAPHGIDDLVQLVLRPTPGVYTDTKRFYERMNKKDWLRKWPKLKIVT
ncbi:MAG: nucleotidyltransferase family protein [Patescibacteria group bacterium]